MTTALQSLTQKLAHRFDLSDSSNLADTLKATAFKGNVNDAQMTALLIVANQHGLNPWTKEIYAFPDKNNGIVPVVGVDGWSAILNRNEQFDGIEFEQDETSCTCRIYRKDRSRAISVTEYLNECKRNTPAWQSHPKRMLRHKAMIQCARLAFGFTGIYDQDEAERIRDAEPINGTPNPTIIDVTPTAPLTLITNEQKQTLLSLMELTQSDMQSALNYYGVKSVDELTQAKAEEAIKFLHQRLNGQQNAQESKPQEEALGEEITL